MAEKKQPRVRRVETVRDRNQKATEKAAANAGKVKKRPVRRALSAVGKPLSKPAKVAAKPFKTRPVRFTAKWIGLIVWPPYFRNSFKEIRQVKWPTSRETWKLTFAVLAFAVVFGFLVSITDFGLDKVIRRIVLR